MCIKLSNILQIPKDIFLLIGRNNGVSRVFSSNTTAVEVENELLATDSLLTLISSEFKEPIDFPSLLNLQVKPTKNNVQLYVKNILVNNNININI